MTNTWTTYALKQRDLELVVLPGIGGRLWDIVFQGQSLLFQNPDLAGRHFDPAALDTLPTRSPQFGFPLWGGEKTWVAPDTDWAGGAPYPVLDSAPYSILRRTDARIEMQSQPCPISNLRVMRRIALNGANSFSIDHHVTNTGDTERTAGIWSVMMLRHPATIIADTDAEPVSPVFGDAAPFIRQDGARLTIACPEPGEFKIGAQVPSGRTRILSGDANSPVRLDCTVAPANAADRFAHGHNVEAFNSGDYAYCEAEWHGPTQHLPPGGGMRFTQDFKVS